MNSRRSYVFSFSLSCRRERFQTVPYPCATPYALCDFPDNPMTALEISAAYLVDLFFGDPPGYPHPVRLIGQIISLLENKFLQWAHTPWMQRLSGVIMAATIVSGAGIFTWAIIQMAGWVH